MVSSYQYKLKPTYKQKKILNQSFDCVRFVYNWGLRRKYDVLDDKKLNYPYIEMSKELTKLKKTHKWLYNAPNVCLQQSLQDLDSDFTKFYRNKVHFPRFKTKKCNNNISKYNLSVHFDFNEWKVKIPYCNWVKIHPNKKFNPIQVDMGTLEVYKDKCGEYWCSILVYTDDFLSVKTPIQQEQTVGVALSDDKFAYLSDGTAFHKEVPSFFATKHTKTCSLFKNKRNVKNFIHEFTSWLMKSDFTTFCLEDKSHKKHKFWKELKKQLLYKADYYLKNVIFVGELPQICDNMVDKAIKIKNIALTKQNLVGIEKEIKPK